MNIKLKTSLGALVLIALMTGLDQWTKYAVRAQMHVGESILMIPRFFYLTYVQNTGAGFSIFEGYGKLFFFLVTILAMGIMIYAFYHTDRPGIQLCLALIFAGALGNFIDRMVFGYVTDFFHFIFFGWSFPVFNVADICITVGFVLLVVDLLLDEWRARRHA